VRSGVRGVVFFGETMPCLMRCCYYVFSKKKQRTTSPLLNPPRTRRTMDHKLASARAPVVKLDAEYEQSVAEEQQEHMRFE
jgi:hypothetical protein